MYTVFGSIHWWRHTESYWNWCGILTFILCSNRYFFYLWRSCLFNNNFKNCLVYARAMQWLFFFFFSVYTACRIVDVFMRDFRRENVLNYRFRSSKSENPIQLGCSEYAIFLETLITCKINLQNLFYVPQPNKRKLARDNLWDRTWLGLGPGTGPSRQFTERNSKISRVI